MCHSRSGKPSERATSTASMVLPVPGSPFTRSGRASVIAAFPEVYHVPRIAGQQPGYIIAALKAYKSGERSHPSMRGIAASLSEEQMQKLAEYYGAPAK